MSEYSPKTELHCQWPEALKFMPVPDRIAEVEAFVDAPFSEAMPLTSIAIVADVAKDAERYRTALEAIASDDDQQPAHRMRILAKKVLEAPDA